MKLSVIMPVYNEKDTIREILRRVREVLIDKEIIVVDDFSTDGTRDILQQENRDGTRILAHPKNLGKGHAIRTALKHVTGDIIIIQDGDLEYDPQDYLELIKPILERKADVVYGSRILKKGFTKSYNRFYWGGKFLTRVTNILYGAKLTDESTCYKVFKTEILKNIDLRCKRFEFCAEVTGKVLKKGYSIMEIPISYYPRKIEEGKKIRWKDGLESLYTLIKYRIVD